MMALAHSLGPGSAATRAFGATASGLGTGSDVTGTQAVSTPTNPNQGMPRCIVPSRVPVPRSILATNVPGASPAVRPVGTPCSASPRHG